jgi:hypothetical protein
VALAETAELAVRLTLDDNKFKRTLGSMESRLHTFGNTAKRIGKGVALGLGVGATAGIVLLGDSLRKGLAALKDDAVVAAQTEAVIKSTGGAAGVTAAQVGELADRLSKLNAVQDDVVQGAENVILRFTNIGGKDLPRFTQAVIDMAAATGKGADALAIKLGRALDDPTKGLSALSREGITFTKTEQKRIAALVKANRLGEAQALILGKVERKFKGVAQAQAEADPGRGLTLSIERLQKVLAKNLLPVVQKVQERLTEFFDDPKTQAAVQRIGDTIAGLFTDQNINTVLGGIDTAAKAVGTAISAFNSLPPEIKALAIGAFAVNKVTGGAIGGAASALGKVLGAGLQKIFAANVTVVGGNVSGGGAPGAGGGAGKLSNALSLATIVASAFAVWETQQQVSGASTAQAKGLQDSLNSTIRVKTPQELQTALDGVNQGIRDLKSNPLYVLVQGEALTTLEQMASDIRTQQERNAQPAFREGERNANAPDRSSSIDKLRAKLAAVINQEGAAIRSGNTKRAAALERKADTLRDRITEAGRETMAATDRNKRAIANRLATTNAKLGQIVRKPTKFTANTVVNVNTSVSVSYLQKQTRYKERVAKTGTLVAS